MQLSKFRAILGFVTIAALPSASNLLLTLVLLRGLGIEGFATWSLIEPLILIFATIGAVGIQFGVLFTTASGAADPRRSLGAAIATALPTSLLLATVVWFLSRQWLGSVGYFSLLIPLGAEATSLLIISSLRGQRRTGAWIAFEAIRSLGLVVIAFLALWLGLGWVRNIDQFLILRGVFTGSAVLAIAIWLRADLNLDRDLILRMVRYGLPIAGASLVGMVTSSADRFLMALLHVDLPVIASYAAHQRLTGILSVLTVTPLNLWFAVEAMRRDTVTDAPFFEGVLITVLVALSVLMLTAFVGGPLIWPWLFPGLTFNPFIFCVLTLTIVPQSLAIVLNIGGLREKKTHFNAIVVACGSAAMLLFGIPLVHYASSAGAAVARLLSFTATAAAARTISQKIAPVSHRIWPIVPVMATIAAASGSLFYEALNLPLWLLPLVTVGLVTVVLIRESDRLRLLIKD